MKKTNIFIGAAASDKGSGCLFMHKKHSGWVRTGVYII